MAPHAAAPVGRCDPNGAFAGPYIGAAAGFASHRDEITPVAPAAGSLRDRDTSFSFGGYAGYNLQCDRVVFGVETDFNWANTGTGASDTTGGTAISSLDWYGTTRGRLGYVIHDNILLYGTAGVAYANVDHRLDQATFPGPFSQSDGDIRAGWVVGGGIELLHDCNWMLRAEGMFVDLSDLSRTYTVNPGPACAGGPCTLGVKWDDEFWVGRIGLTYKFGHREEVVPLK